MICFSLPLGGSFSSSTIPLNFASDCRSYFGGGVAAAGGVFWACTHRLENVSAISRKTICFGFSVFGTSRLLPFEKLGTGDESETPAQVSMKPGFSGQYLTPPCKSRVF